MGNFNVEVEEDRDGCENVAGTMVMEEDLLNLCSPITSRSEWIFIESHGK
jgi:hypothetical protein